MKHSFFRKFLFLSLAIVVLSPATLFSKDKIKESHYSTFLPSVFSRNSEVIIEPWNSPEGIRRLENSQYKNDFYEMASFFQPQINPLYCGMASAVIILNTIKSKIDSLPSQPALEVKRPAFISGPGTIPFNSYSQFTFLDENTDKIKDRTVINLRNIADGKDKINPGVTLRQLTDMLRSVYGLKVSIYYAGTSDKRTIAKFRNLIKRVTLDKKYYILVNFYGKSLGLKTSGHMSPIVAYEEVSDSVLVLDVAGHKNPWYWVKIDHLYQAMNTKDGNMNRGYLIISDK